MSNIDDLIKRLKKAKDAIEKDDKISLDRVKEIMRNKIKDVPGSKIADHYRDIDETIPAKQRANIKNSLKVQETKVAAPKLKVVKTAADLADELIKSLSSMDKSPSAPAPAPKQKTPVAGATGWAQDPSTGVFHHGVHGAISTHKVGDKYEVRVHNRHKTGKLGTFNSPAEAGAKIRAHMDWLKSFKQPTMGKNEVEVDDNLVDGDIGGVMKKEVRKSLPQWTEDEAARALAKIAPLGKQKLQPTNSDMEQSAINMGLAVTEQQAEAMEKGHQSAITDWFAEAMKPISQRFSSPEEEEAYWASVRVSDRDDGKSGY